MVGSVSEETEVRTDAPHFMGFDVEAIIVKCERPRGRKWKNLREMNLLGQIAASVNTRFRSSEQHERTSI